MCSRAAWAAIDHLPTDVPTPIIASPLIRAGQSAGELLRLDLAAEADSKTDSAGQGTLFCCFCVTAATVLVGSTYRRMI